MLNKTILFIDVIYIKDYKKEAKDLILDAEWYKSFVKDHIECIREYFEET